MYKLKGNAVSTGAAIGKALIIKERELMINEQPISESEVESELNLFKTSIESVNKDIQDYIRNFSLSTADIAVLETHSMILLDPEFHNEIENHIKNEKRNVEHAVQIYFTKAINFFNQIEKELFAERSIDYYDVHKRLLMQLQKIDQNILEQVSTGDIVVIADLPPSLVSHLQREKVAGIIVTKGTKNSHAVIIARAYGIPIVTGIKYPYPIKNSDLLILDANKGIVIGRPSKKKLQQYKELIQKLKSDSTSLKSIKKLRSCTADSQDIKILNNIEIPEEINLVLDQKTDGIGLFRTEFFYMDRQSLPEEEEQYFAYRSLAHKLAGKPIVIRTIDIGGDKIGGCLSQMQEMNPYLGCRGIRFSLKNISIFKSQLRAIIRSSEYGNIRIMFPMVASIEEFQKAKKIVLECQKELSEANIPFSKSIPIGTMIEIPSAALCSNHLAKYCDFFSIGTNDLLQYTLAVDRNNLTISDKYNPYNPAFLNLIIMTISSAIKENIPVAVCGELASDLDFTAFLLNAGLKEFSVGIDHSLELKKHIRSIDSKKGAHYLDELKNCETTEDTKHFIKKLNWMCRGDETIIT